MDIIFLPGFWAEYGMGTQTSAFGSKIIWQQGGTPSPGRVIYDLSEVDRIKKPNSATDGLLPFVLNRIENNRKKIEGKGHYTKFAFSWGLLILLPIWLDILSFCGIKDIPGRDEKID